MQREALAAGDPALALMAHSLIWLTRFITASGAFFYPVDQRLGKFTYGPIVARAEGLGATTIEWAISRYRERYHRLDPFAPRRFGATETYMFDVADVGEGFSDGAYATEHLSSLEMCAQTSLFLRASGRIVAGIDLLRSATDPALTGEQVRFLRASHPMLEQAYVCAFGLATAPERPDETRASALTRREFDVARLVAAGASNGEIARALSITEGTVKTHLVRVFAKLRVRSRTQLAVMIRNGHRTGLDAALTVSQPGLDDRANTSSQPQLDF